MYLIALLAHLIILQGYHSAMLNVLIYLRNVEPGEEDQVISGAWLQPTKLHRSNHKGVHHIQLRHAIILAAELTHLVREVVHPYVFCEVQNQGELFQVAFSCKGKSTVVNQGQLRFPAVAGLLITGPS